MATQDDMQTESRNGQPVDSLTPEISRLHTIDAMLAALSALAVDKEDFEISLICDVIREQVSMLSDRLDRIDMGLACERSANTQRHVFQRAQALRPAVGA